MRRDHHVVAPEERIVPGRRFGVEDVQGRAGQVPAVEGGAKGLFVHQSAPRHVDEERARFHLREAVAVHQAAGLFRKRRVHRDDVRPGEHGLDAVFPFDAHFPYPFVSDVGIVGDHPHAERDGHPGHPASDPAEPDQSQRSPVQLHPLVGGQVVLPRMFREFPGHTLDVLYRGEDQGDRRFRRGQGRTLRRVADRDAPRRGIRHDDVVDADTRPADDLHFRKPVQEFPVVGSPRTRYDRMGARKVAQRVVAGLLRRAMHEDAFIEFRSNGGRHGSIRPEPQHGILLCATGRVSPAGRTNKLPECG